MSGNFLKDRVRMLSVVLKLIGGLRKNKTGVVDLIFPD